MVLGLSDGREKGRGGKYWVCSGGRGGIGGLCGAMEVHSALGPKCLLTDWCLVTMMVGMGELSAWPLTEPRI